ncbi:bifunctional biotin--[acetyl-CoA-carboxylase] ligase/biotin operon repressor BirA [Marinimicrobium sp. ABcell2]|uniref:bifunctional biotin--[acetyl-CoA-carboxylase] ligase/biotin operon repressor BirA n=1 Tax=Marinimicrobium sp. ABcell2 TaxID=3069751 RepID=UPI0027B3ED6B|nr:bifunctional biotin--[acetyl-CoA-carboxylase] ligase/biotin operon repressor BirA [Marinimicrobium sp. ABcell2]MDQ2078206.1 bifunctional biotin--[acetyl-CoA-carboxylase] ligase/biotin operon repressor BirA [Marinimicrobium sp. ABcell2]
MTKLLLDYAALEPLLILLADGEFHSGQELGDHLGVSRTAVWKHLQKLEVLGLPLTSSRGHGYCLEGGLELFDSDVLRAHLTPAAREALTELELFPLTDSTNARAMAKAALGRGGYVCLAEQQSAGRGRRGRHWVSPFGKNIYLSLSWCFESGAAALEGLSLAVGVALVRVLKELGLPELALKWPNDVLCHRSKLAGVLLEMTGDPSGACQVVVGVGLNVDMPEPASTGIDQPWTDVQSTLRKEGLPPVSRNFLAAALISELLVLLKDYETKGFEAYRKEWLALDAFAGREVELRATDRVIRGRVVGVGETGALCLDVNGEQQFFYGGEVSLRAVS